MSIAEANYPNNTYITYDGEIVKISRIVEPLHAANATEEDGPFSDTLIGDIVKVWDLIYPLLNFYKVWPHMKRYRSNCDGQKAILASYDHFWGPNNAYCLQNQA